MANLCSHWNDNYGNSSYSEKCLQYNEERCKQNCSCAVIKNVPMDQGLEGNIENENGTKGLGSIISIPK